MIARRLPTVVVALFSLVGAAVAEPACFKNDRTVEGLARLYGATQVCPQFRPMSRGEFAALLAIGDLVDDISDVETCRYIIDTLLIYSTGLMSKPGVCAEAASAARQHKVAQRWLRR